MFNFTIKAGVRTEHKLQRSETFAPESSGRRTPGSKSIRRFRTLPLLIARDYLTIS